MLSDGLHDVPAGKFATVVTHLEMREKPVLRQVALPDALTFRQVAPDLDWYRDVFGRVGQDWLWYGRLKLSDADLLKILTDPDVAVFTLSKDGKDHALLELDFREPGVCELAYFGLTSDLIGTGAGRYLMNEAITRAWDRDIHRFHVHTCTMDSQQALGFYVRSGFSPTHQQIEIDDDPRLLGLRPRSTGTHVPMIEPS